MAEMVEGDLYDAVVAPRSRRDLEGIVPTWALTRNKKRTVVVCMAVDVKEHSSMCKCCCHENGRLFGSILMRRCRWWTRLDIAFIRLLSANSYLPSPSAVK